MLSVTNCPNRDTSKQLSDVMDLVSLHHHLQFFGFRRSRTNSYAACNTFLNRRREILHVNAVRLQVVDNCRLYTEYIEQEAQPMLTYEW